MRLLDLVPVTAEVITPEMERYISRYLDRDTELVSGQITEGPLSIECEYDEAMAQADIIRHCIQAEKDGFDGIFINCFGDPGVRAARECVDIPVFGGFEPAVYTAMGLADKISVVTVLKNVLPLIDGEISKARINGRVVSVRSVDIPVLDLQDHGKLCRALIEESIKAIESDGAGGIVLGCTAMVDVAEMVREGLQEAGHNVPVIEAAQTAVMMLEMYVKMGLHQSRVTYMPVPKK